MVAEADVKCSIVMTADLCFSSRKDFLERCS